MELKHRIETKIIVDYSDLDRLITEYFKFVRDPSMVASWEPKQDVYYKKYEFVAMEEASNYASYDYDIDGYLDEFDQKDIDKMLETETFPQYSTRVIMNYLASKGVIDKGNYLIDVFW